MVATLTDSLERLSRTANIIHDLSSSIAHVPPKYSKRLAAAGPFTRAMLNQDLGDVIRDIDPSELGLFQLIGKPVADDTPRTMTELSRAEFTTATPLRKPIARQDHKAKDPDPEIYANAALICIGRYEMIRSMSHVRSQAMSVLEQLAIVRQSLTLLTEEWENVQSAVAPSTKDTADEEEMTINRLQIKLKELNKRKELCIDKERIMHQPSKPAPKITRSYIGSSDHSAPNGNPIRAFRFEDENLLEDDGPELMNVSVNNFSADLSSPPSTPTEHLPTAESGNENEITTNEVHLNTTTDASVTQPQSSTSPLQKPSASNLKNSHPMLGTSRIKISIDVERIISKFWATIGDSVFPGLQKSLSVKDTIENLKALSEMTPSPHSPATSDSAASNVPAQKTAQQILTAHLLMSLLNSHNRSLHLNKVKALLLDKAGTNGTAMKGALANILGAPPINTNKVLFSCVAKRLLKIDRGGGEQVVKFDV